MYQIGRRKSEGVGGDILGRVPEGDLRCVSWKRETGEATEYMRWKRLRFRGKEAMWRRMPKIRWGPPLRAPSGRSNITRPAFNSASTMVVVCIILLVLSLFGSLSFPFFIYTIGLCFPCSSIFLFVVLFAQVVPSFSRAARTNTDQTWVKKALGFWEEANHVQRGRGGRSH